MIAALLALSLPCAAPGAHAEPVRMEQADPEQKRAAQKTFEAGDELYESGRYAEALTAFRASHALVASPNSRLMVARCLRELGRAADAYVELEATLADAAASSGRYAETAEAARTELGALRGRIAHVVVELPSDPAIVEFSIGERRFSSKDFGRSIPVTPGRIVLVFQRANGERLPLELNVAVGETRSAALGADAAVAEPHDEHVPPRKRARVSAEPAQGQGSWQRTAAFVAGGAAVAGLAGFAVFGALNQARYAELERECPDGRCARERQADIDAGRRYQTLANAGLLLGAVGAATSVTLFLLAPSQDRPEPLLRARIDVSSIQISGSF